MIDLHTHTIFSDGDLIPSELVRRAFMKGYRGIALTDHADFTNYQFIIENILKVKEEIINQWDIKILCGIEITHVPPKKIDSLAKKAKEFGAEIIVVHGETIVEPVEENTNLYAIESEYVDILAHPGLISEKEVELAVNNKKYLEITTRKGHSLTNGHVFKLAKQLGAKLLLNNDAHSPDDLVSIELAKKIVMGCGGKLEDYDKMIQNAEELLKNGNI